MAKYWFGSLELLGDQRDEKGHLRPTSVTPIKGWKVPAKDYPLVHREKASEETRLYWVKNFLPAWLGDWIPEGAAALTDMEKDRNALAEQWWADAEVWWASQQVNKDLKGEVQDTRELDYTPIRETGDYQIRVTGPVEVPEPLKAKEEPKKGAKL